MRVVRRRSTSRCAFLDSSGVLFRFFVFDASLVSLSLVLLVSLSLVLLVTLSIVSLNVCNINCISFSSILFACDKILISFAKFYDFVPEKLIA